MLNWLFGKKEGATAPPPASFGIDELDPFSASAYTQGQAEYAWLDGEKYPGGFGPTQLFVADYWTLRQRSSQLFEDNLYARGLIRRLVTNEINTGLTLESFPEESIIGVPDESLTEWSENVENRYHIWANTPKLCDYYGVSTIAQLQSAARVEALVSGDVLVVIRQNRHTQLPQVQLIRGERVRSPITAYPASLPSGHEIKHGVEFDANNRRVAFWVTNDDGLTSERIPAYGSRTGRRIAWLVYGTDKRLDDCRGKPLLSLVLQSLKELDRYRDAAQRKAAINAMVAVWIKKSSDKAGTLPLTGAATRRDEYPADNGASGSARRGFQVDKSIPGIVIQELQEGEEPTPHQSGTDVNYGPFEDVIINAIAWANELPPEIMRLHFSNNYSASQAAINEFKTYLNRVRTEFGQVFCQPIYEDWLISSVLIGKIEAQGLIDAWRDVRNYEVFAAWVAADWSGAIKPSTDMVKQYRGMSGFVKEGWITNERAAREVTGTKFRQNIKRLRRENELKVEAARPLAEFRERYGVDIDDVVAGSAQRTADLVAQSVVDLVDSDS